jgi:ATP-dependent Clp protease adaptor protein ClpS
MPLPDNEIRWLLPADCSPGGGAAAGGSSGGVSASGEADSVAWSARRLPAGYAPARSGPGRMPSGPRDLVGMGDDPDPLGAGSDPFGGEGESESPTMVVAPPRRQTSRERSSKRQPRYHVLLWDSSDHTFAYVEKMLQELFGHEPEQCKLLAKEVDQEGRAVVYTTTLEHAELKRDQIHAYGRDHLEGSKGSMWSTIEPDR